MEQVKQTTAAGDSLTRYASPKTRVVFVKTHGILCLSDPSLSGYENGSHSDGGEMGED